MILKRKCDIFVVDRTARITMMTQENHINNERNPIKWINPNFCVRYATTKKKIPNMK